MSKFVFKTYGFDAKKAQATFTYGFENGRDFTETVTFCRTGDYDAKVLDRALFLAFVLIGVSYYKSFPSVEVDLDEPIDKWQAEFFDRVYQEGLSQFAYGNRLTRDDLAHFKTTAAAPVAAVKYDGSGILALQSGGKDSILTATLLKEHNIGFTSWYLSSSDSYPKMLDEICDEVVVSRRTIDKDALHMAFVEGGKNGHVPITYIVQSLALIQAILLGKKDILTSIAHEGEEPHAHIGDLAVTHQWSKTWSAEQVFAEYVARYISPDIRIGSPLRLYSELRVAELFAEKAWQQYGHEFSSCNVANYLQGEDNTKLSWCGNCPKCANSYLLFAPFLPADEIKSIFHGQDLFDKPSLELTFRGLLGIDGIPKPFECIGEINELRQAYQMAQDRGGYQKLPFDVPKSKFDYQKTYPSQEWATEVLQ